MSYVYVVTDVELGWDCVVGVYSTNELAEAACKPHPDDYAEVKEWYDKHLNKDGMFDTRVIHHKKLDMVW